MLAQNLCSQEDMSDVLGDPIYSKDDFSIHEVDGEEHKVRVVTYLSRRIHLQLWRVTNSPSSL